MDDNIHHSKSLAYDGAIEFRDFAILSNGDYAQDDDGNSICYGWRIQPAVMDTYTFATSTQVDLPLHVKMFV